MPRPDSIFDLCVIGGGSGGFAAAFAAARRGRSVVLVEKADCLGGNAVRAGVNTWEAGIGGTDIPRLLYERMVAHPEAVGIGSTDRHCCWPHRNDPPFPGGESVIDPSRSYPDSLRRYGTRGLIDDAELVREIWHGVTFEPIVCADVQLEMLKETGNCRVRLLHEFKRVASIAGNRLSAIEVEGPNGLERIKARHFIDATADVLVSRALGCPLMSGREGRDTFGEPDAPDAADPKGVNAATLVYRISRREGPEMEDKAAPFTCWFRAKWPVASFTQLPNGDRMVNMLPTMEGDELLERLAEGPVGYAGAVEECTRRVYGHWQHVRQEYPEFRAFRLRWIAPALGIRESRRVVCEYVLRQQDLLQGLSGQTHPDIIAIADHALDTHGRHSKGCVELAQPYGIPFRCLVPKGWSNVLVACRGAGFSHLAASSCRLSRTMMALGHAAGLAVEQAQEDSVGWSDLDMAKLRASLISEGAPLDWKMNPSARSTGSG